MHRGSRIYHKLSFLGFRRRCRWYWPDFWRREECSFAVKIADTFLPSPMQLCGRIFLGARFPEVFDPRIFGAQRLRSWGSHFWTTPRDGPFPSRLLRGAMCPWRIWRCNLIPIVRPSVKIDLDFGGFIFWNRQPKRFDSFSNATDPFPPLFFYLMLGWLSTSASLNRHLSPNLHPASVLWFWHTGGCQ